MVFPDLSGVNANVLPQVHASQLALFFPASFLRVFPVHDLI
jgi:hypothetical protein